VIEATARPGKGLTSHATAEAAKMAAQMTAPTAASAHMPTASAHMSVASAARKRVSGQSACERGRRR
jgi:hypothetical protein